MNDMEKLQSLLIDVVNQADELADETSILIHRVRLKSIRDEADKLLGRVQAMLRHDLLKESER